MEIKFKLINHQEKNLNKLVKTKKNKTKMSKKNIIIKIKKLIKKIKM